MILKEPIVARNGKVKIPNKPGLGVELDDDIIRKIHRNVDQFPTKEGRCPEKASVKSCVVAG